MLDWLAGKKKTQGPKPQGGEKNPAGKGSGPGAAPGEAPAGKAQRPTPGPRAIRNRCFLPSKPDNDQELALAQNVFQCMPRVEEMLSDPGFDLPMLPEASVKLMSLLNNPAITAGEISRTVQRDPVLAAKFFNLANSAIYGARRRIDSMDHAVSWLGLAKIKNLVMSISLHATLFRDEKLKGPATDLWKHSLACAVAAETLARDTEASPEGCFMAGLLHDIGKLPAILILRKALPKETGTIRPDFYTAMVEQFHLRAGVALLKRWMLPPEAQLAIQAHVGIATLEELEKKAQSCGPELSTPAMQKVLGTTVLADRAVSSLGYGDEPDEVNIVGAPLALQLGVIDSRAETILEALPYKIDQLPEL